MRHSPIAETGSKSFALRIFIFALILRVIPVLLARGLGIGLDDMFQYDMLARSLASGNGFRWYAQEDLNQLAAFVDFDLSSVESYDPDLGIQTSFRAPLYPTFLAIVYFFNGLDFSRFFAARLAQAALLGAPLAPLTYWIARRLFPLSSLKQSNKEEREKNTDRAARLAAWVVACYPMLLVYPLGLGTENPFFVLLLTSFFFLLRASEQSNPAHFLLAGLFLGLTTLTRSVILPFAGLAILWAWFVLKNKRGAVLLGVASVLTVAPWMIRNSLLHQKLTGIETSMGYNLYLGYHPQGNGSFVFGPSLDLLPILDDAERDRIGTEKALEFIRAQPQRVIPLAIKRLGFFFGLEKRVLIYFYSNNLLGYIALPFLLSIAGILLLPFVIISILSALGLAYLRPRPAHILLLCLFGGYILPHVFILSEDRFHLALVPFIAILAAQVWVNGWTPLRVRWDESSTGRLIVSLALCTALLLIANWGFELIRDADKIALLLGPNGNQSGFPY
ncbi:MAG TPA: glycosyltransferase family 39 protein [Anaerolineales bacterium]|nr:glycosyltransferase family 39 protein [Anaerolineales bacterium]